MSKGCEQDQLWSLKVLVGRGTSCRVQNLCMLLKVLVGRVREREREKVPLCCLNLLLLVWSFETFLKFSFFKILHFLLKIWLFFLEIWPFFKKFGIVLKIWHFLKNWLFWGFWHFLFFSGLFLGFFGLFWPFFGDFWPFLCHHLMRLKNLYNVSEFQINQFPRLVWRQLVS